MHYMQKNWDIFSRKFSKELQTYSDQKQKHSLITKACFEDCCIFSLIKPTFLLKLPLKSNVGKIKYCHLSGPHVPWVESVLESDIRSIERYSSLKNSGTFRENAYSKRPDTLVFLMFSNNVFKYLILMNANTLSCTLN